MYTEPRSVSNAPGKAIQKKERSDSTPNTLTNFKEKKKSWHIPEPYGKMMAELGLENFTILMAARPQMVTKTMVITITNLQFITHLE
jgi:hypothetical protein